jgi:hypothetical protein
MVAPGDLHCTCVAAHVSVSSHRNVIGVRCNSVDNTFERKKNNGYHRQSRSIQDELVFRRHETSEYTIYTIDEDTTNNKYGNNPCAIESMVGSTYGPINIPSGVSLRGKGMGNDRMKTRLCVFDGPSSYFIHLLFFQAMTSCVLLSTFSPSWGNADNDAGRTCRRANLLMSHSKNVFSYHSHFKTAFTREE